MTQHLFTVDVEEYFQVLALEPYIARESWASRPSRVEASVDKLLALLAERGATATFFTLGAVADRNPGIVKRIAAAGHEVASHGYSHRRIPHMKREEFRAEVARSRAVLSDLSGQDVQGFRAPNFSIVAGCEWAFDILLEEGYSYDSSVFPSRRAALSQQAGAHFVRTRRGDLLELAMTPASFGFLRIPAGGGAWFRLLPYELTRRALQQAASRGGPGVFYIHPWELDADQPRLPVDGFTRARHYGGLSRTVPRLRRLLREFSFTSVAGWLNSTSWIKVPA